MYYGSSNGPHRSAPEVWIVGSYYLELRLPFMKQLRDRGFNVTAVGQADQHEFFRDRGFSFHQYPITRSLNPLSDFRAYRSLVGLLAKWRPDVVHAVNTKPALIAPKAAARANISSVVRTITGLGAAFSSHSATAKTLQFAYCQLQKQAAKSTAMTVFQNRDDQEYFLRKCLVEPEKAVLIPSSGIDVDAFRNRSGDSQLLDALRRQLGLQGKTVVSMISRVIGAKGVREFAEAAAIVRRRFPNTEFLLIGPSMGGRDEVPTKWLEAQSPNLKYLGQRDDIANLLAISNLFVLPSYFREGVPRVLLEAGAMGLPLLTTDMPGCREVVNEGENGFLLPPRDGSAIAESIGRLLQDPDLQRRMGNASRQHVEANFHLRTVTDAYAAIYHKLLSQPVTAMCRAASEDYGFA